MKHSFLRVILAIALAACLTGVAAAQTDIEVWITGTASEDVLPGLRVKVLNARVA